MKNIYKLLIVVLAASVIAGCTKYGNDVNLEEAGLKQERLNNSIQQKLADAPNGWLLLVPNLDTTIKTATPVLLKFDTLKGTFTSKSPYPASTFDVPTFYNLSSATGAPLLSFATGSIFSSWYEMGGITDYYFKILDASADTIALQPYRKGTIYASEGGVQMKMVRQKTPLTWFDNPIDLVNVFTNHASPFWINATNPLKLTYQDGYVQPAFNAEFDAQSAGNLAFFKANVQICKNLGATPVSLFLNGDYANLIIWYCGTNALISHVDNGFTPAYWFVTGPTKVIKTIKTDYLLVRSVNPALTRIELFAVDANGKEIIAGTLESK